MRDVRMRGFDQRSDVEEVERLLSGFTHVLEAEAVPVTRCAGRVLTTDVQAPLDVPGFRRSAMDGYALKGEESFGASDYAPLSFQVMGQSLPGQPFSGSVETGQAVRIMTGAPVPHGADAVVQAEVCQEADGVVQVSQPVTPQKNVGAVGEDIRQGEKVLAAGRRLRPQDAGVLSSLGMAEVPCVRRPRVEVLTTGDELLPPGSRPRGPNIADSNSVVLGALVRRDGGVITRVALLADRPQVLRNALKEAKGDVVLISGGSSVGQEDHAPRLLAELGSLDFHGVTMRPSSPAGGGRLGRTLVFLLPGNPVSCLCAYEFFAGPTIRGLGGRPRSWPHRRMRGRLGRKIVSQVGRTDYVRVAVEQGRIVAVATAGASILSSTVRAVGAVIVPRELEGMAAGKEVEVLLYDDDGPEPLRP